MEITASSLDGSVIFHAISEISGFLLFMHQQIPALLQDITAEFDSRCENYKDLELAQREDQVKPALRRKHAGEMREAKRGIQRFQKLMAGVSHFQTALKTILTETPRFEKALLILGGNPMRPQHVYELSFFSGRSAGGEEVDFGKSRAAEVLCKKAIRGLVTKNVGSVSYPGPLKLFLMVKAPSCFNQPLHFLPKRDFKYSNKIVPMRLSFKSKTENQSIDQFLQTGSSNGFAESDSDGGDFIWFQCRHVIKGLAFNTEAEGGIAQHFS
ncbi:PREDICTED: uncharacterized protein LOC101313771 [Fragaria vesca subsp. vesca]|uniref:uncharacterized protein LOC101313771 n=1 Tax=Fragaria vesca subsp. vesca TaxID=101020 RepID=UPI0002C34B4A|nr:PREDICTED: uncharacterized protein LOC101313771 [Fragaria vesca subsp. vesca]